MALSMPNLKSILIDIGPRLLLGGVFLIGAVDGFAFIFTGAHFIHPPTSVEGLALEAALKEAVFFWPLMKSIELLGALLLLTNRAPALGLALLAPIMAVIILFHAVLNPGGLPIVVILIVTGNLIFWAHAPDMRPFLKLACQRQRLQPFLLPPETLNKEKTYAQNHSDA